MRIFIDESGTFSWGTPGRSVFCGVTVPDRDLGSLLDRFSSWRRMIIGHSRRELKGSELTDNQLASFMHKVLPSADKDIWLTIVGVDTRLTREQMICRLRDQAATIFNESSQLCARRGNAKLQETYRQMSGWISNRSPQNVLWIIALIETLTKSLNHTIVRFAEPEDDEDFRSIKIQIDQSFISRDQHVAFWREWLRAELAKASRKEGLVTITEWKQRNHPFLQRYSIRPGLCDLSKLYVNDTGFFSSARSPGLQIADICAHIALRHHRRTGGEAAYQQLRRRIVARDGAEINLIHVNESSLHKDDPRNHVRLFNVEEYKRRADLFRATRELET